MSRGRRGEDIFLTAKDYDLFITVLQETVEMFNLKVSGFCLMPTHYHLLLCTPDGNLSRCMRQVNGVYTQRFNRRHEKDGQLFRGRFKSVLVDMDNYLLEVLRYIHNDPVRAEIVENVDDFSWSSHKGYCSRAKKWHWLHKDFPLAMFSKKSSQAKKGYLEFMRQQESDEIEAFYAKKNLPSILGDEDFKDWLREKFHDLRLKPEVPAAKELALGGKTIRDMVGKEFRVDNDTLMISRRGTENLARDVAIYLQRKYCGQTLAEMGNDYSIGCYSTVSSAIQRIKSRLLQDSKLRKKVSKLEKKLDKGQR